MIKVVTFLAILMSNSTTYKLFTKSELHHEKIKFTGSFSGYNGKLHIGTKFTKH